MRCSKNFIPHNARQEKTRKAETLQVINSVLYAGLLSVNRGDI